MEFGIIKTKRGINRVGKIYYKNNRLKLNLYGLTKYDRILLKYMFYHFLGIINLHYNIKDYDIKSSKTDKIFERPKYEINEYIKEAEKLMDDIAEKHPRFGEFFDMARKSYLEYYTKYNKLKKGNKNE